MIKNYSDKDENNFGFADNNCGVEENNFDFGENNSGIGENNFDFGENNSEFGAKRCKTSYKWYIIDGMAFKLRLLKKQEKPVENKALKKTASKLLEAVF